MRILIVEDEKDLNQALAKGLKKVGYASDSAYDGQEALSLYYVNDYDLILLDLSLPKMSGLDVLKEIRLKDLHTKIMIVSARTAIEQRVLGLDLGANDYLIKPFDFRELDARIRTLLRMDYSLKPSILQCQDLLLDSNTCIAEIKGNKIELTKKEYAILHYLMMNKERLVPAEELFEHVWNNEADEFSNVLKFHVYSLKKKLAQYSKADYIENKRGIGYRMVQHVSD